MGLHYQGMQDWIALKQAIAVWTGLDHDALNILGSLLLCMIAAFACRRPLSHPLPWLSVFTAAVANELGAGFADGVYDHVELAMSRHDVPVVMIVPTLLFAVSRWAPQLLCTQIHRQFIVPMGPLPSHPPLIEGEFQEIDQAEARFKRRNYSASRAP